MLPCIGPSVFVFLFLNFLLDKDGARCYGILQIFYKFYKKVNGLSNLGVHSL